MKKLILCALALMLGISAGAQETYCFVERDTCSLFLDIWRPAVAEQPQKPAILFVFGGGFIMGRRDDPFSQNWYKRLNNEGYPVVAIDYRLGMKGVKVGKGLSGAVKSMDSFQNAQQIGVEDVFSAVSFLAAHPELGIPVDNIVIAGSSAGAIISLASAYAIANGQTAGLPDGFNFKGVMSFAGGIMSKKGAPKFAKEPCPILLLHGTADEAVAYRHFGALGMGIWGSDYIAEHLNKKGWGCCIWRFKDRTHDVAAYMDYIWPIEKEFLEKNVIQGVPCRIDAMVDDPSLPSWKGIGDISVEKIYSNN